MELEQFDEKVILKNDIRSLGYKDLEILNERTPYADIRVQQQLKQIAYVGQMVSSFSSEIQQELELSDQFYRFQLMTRIQDQILILLWSRKKDYQKSEINELNKGMKEGKGDKTQYQSIKQQRLYEGSQQTKFQNLKIREIRELKSQTD